MTERVRVFVGAAADGSDGEAQAVLEYSLRRHASRPVDLTWLTADESWNTSAWGTPFSGLRWSIPHRCGFAGRAVYLDSDMIVRADIAHLWDQPIPAGAIALAKGAGVKLRTCVMLLDCARAGRLLPSLAALKRAPDAHAAVTAMLAARPGAVAGFEGLWNCVDLKGVASADDPAVRLIHYSSIAHQPSLRHATARLAAEGRRHWYDGATFEHWRADLVDLFDAELAAARAAGFDPAGYTPAHPYSPTIQSYRGKRVKGFGEDARS